MAAQQQEPLQSGEAFLRQLVVEHFGSAQDIEAAYLIGAGRRFTVVLITAHQQFNRAAMHALYEREDQVRDALDGILLQIDYIPRLGRSLDSLIPEHAVTLLRR